MLGVKYFSILKVNFGLPQLAKTQLFMIYLNVGTFLGTLHTRNPIR